MKTDYDIIIIGSGAGGGTLAHHLAPSGKSILILERGGWLKREPENWSAEAVFKDNRYVSPDIWHHADNGKPFQPGTYHYVGGATKMYGAALYRLREKDFTPVQHEDGISPGWPLSYTDFEPYYLQAENLYQVHGARGEDPTGAAFQWTLPVFRRYRTSRASSSFPTTSKKAGYHPFHSPCGIMLNEENMPYSRCVRCMDCDGFPCVVHAKADSEVLAVRPALEHGNVTLLIHAKVTRLSTNAEGTSVTGVDVELPDGKETFRGGIVVVSCGAAHTAELLLSSANDKHPHGLANGSDQVGRNYMFHTSQARAGDLQGTESNQIPKDTRVKTISTSAWMTSNTRSATSRWSANRRLRCTGERNPSRPSWRPSSSWTRWPTTPWTSG